jgi:hypothetical protein
MAKLQKSVQKQNLHTFRVLINDTDPSSTYFQVREIKDVLHSGKNAFLIVGSEMLDPGTEVLIEILDIDGNPIFLQAIARYAEGRARVISIEVYEDTPPGPATLTILGSARTDEKGNSIPDGWRNSYNVKWTKKLNVDPLRVNDTKIRLYNQPTLDVVEILAPFRKSIIPALTLNGPGDYLAGTEFGLFVSKPLSGSTATDTQLLSTGSTGGILSRSMEDGTVQLFFTSSQFPDGASFTGSIDAVINTATAFLIDLEGSEDFPLGKSLFTPFYSISFQEDPVFTNTELTRSYADANLAKLQTFSGDVQRAKFYVKSVDSQGDFELVLDTKLASTILTQTASDAYGPTTQMGNIFSQSIIEDYWVAGKVTNLEPQNYKYGSPFVQPSAPEMSRSFSGLLLADDFNRPDSASLGNGWTDHESGGTVVISSNMATASAGLFQTAGGQRSTPPTSSDWIMQHNVNFEGGNGDYVGSLMSNWNGINIHSTGDGYQFQWNANSQQIFIKEWNTGIGSQKDSGVWTDPGSGWSTFRLVGETSASHLLLRAYVISASNSEDQSNDFGTAKMNTDLASPKTAANYGWVSSNAISVTDVYFICGRNISVSGLPSGWKVRIDSRASVTEDGAGNVEINVDEWALPATTLYVLDASDAEQDSITPASGIYGGDTYVFADGVTLTRNIDQLIDSLYISAPDLGNSESDTPQNYIRLNKNIDFLDELEYTFGVNILGVTDVVDNEGKVEIYLSGSAFPIDNQPLGILLATYEVEGGKTRRLYSDQKVNFVPSTDGFGVLNFVIYGGRWYFSDISIISSFEDGFNPDEAEFLIPVTGKRFENLQFKVELFDPNNNFLPIDVLSDTVLFDGGNTLVRGADHRIEGTLTVAPSESGVTVTAEGWMSASIFQTGESAIYLGSGELFNSNTGFLVGQSGSNDSPFISVGDKLLGYVDDETGEFELIISGNITLLSGTIRADQIIANHLSDITGNLGEVIVGRIRSPSNDAGILLGGAEYSSSVVPSAWKDYVNLAATGSQKWLYSAGPDGSGSSFFVDDSGSAYFGGEIQSEFAEISQQLLAPLYKSQTGSARVEIFSDPADPGQDLLRVYDEADFPLAQIGKYTISSGSAGGAQSDIIWDQASGSEGASEPTVGIEWLADGFNARNTLVGTLPASDTLYTVRFGLRLDNSGAAPEAGGSADVTAYGQLQYKLNAGSWTSIGSAKSIRDLVIGGHNGTDQSEFYETVATVPGVSGGDTLIFRIRCGISRTDTGDVPPYIAFAYTFGQTEAAEGITWNTTGTKPASRFNLRLHQRISASVPQAHFRMEPSGTVLPAANEGQQGEFIYVLDIGPYYHDGESWKPFGSGSTGGAAGSGTPGKLAKWDTAITLKDSIVTEAGDQLTVAGGVTASLGFSGDGSAITGLISASHALLADSASYVAGADVAGAVSLADTGSYVTASAIDGTVATALSASYALTSSFAASASYALTSSFAISASHAEAADSADLATSAVTALTASSADTASFLDPEAYTSPRPIKTVVAVYDVVPGDFTLVGNSVAGDVNVRLPDAEIFKGREINIIKSQAGNFVHVIASGSDTIIGNVTKSLTDQYQALTIQPSGTIWWVI